ncbi:MAG: hypothetical protein NC485_13145 [Ruminococcus flavefaciens]|nr:hypothetical protein [Ruminococcus flavefaciens]MCM1060563.1 hypothetical protein [Eubacterium sp.]
MNLKFRIQESIHLKTAIRNQKNFAVSIGYLQPVGDTEDFIYTVSNGLATVTGYKGNKNLVEIPSNLGGGATTIIDKTAFTESEITGVWIPEGVTEIR